MTGGLTLDYDVDDDQTYSGLDRLGRANPPPRPRAHAGSNFLSFCSISGYASFYCWEVQPCTETMA